MCLYAKWRLITPSPTITGGTSKIYGSGATTLTYMMKKVLEGNYRVLAIEVDKKDFMYFNDSDLRSVTSAELETITKNPNSDYEVILVDINDSPKISTIKEVIHLVVIKIICIFGVRVISFK